MNADIKAIKERCDKATPGPWGFSLDVGNRHYITPPTYGVRDYCCLDAGIEREEDADFIAHAREDIPALIAEIESLQAQLRCARNELCLKCGRYHEAHKGACDGCRWKEI